MQALNLNDSNTFDAVIIGGGAAGLFCAGVSASRGLKVLVIDHSEKLAEKIRISGGGRCNFTNKNLDPSSPHKYFLGENPQFCRSALTRYTPDDFIELMQTYKVSFHEKHKGQLFCDRSAQDIIDVLLAECKKDTTGSVLIRNPCKVLTIEHVTNTNTGNAITPTNTQPYYSLATEQGLVRCRSVVIATGGLSIPQIGASDFGYAVAKQFNLPIVSTRPALVPLTFAGDTWAPYAHLSGLSLPVVIGTGEKKSRVEFSEDLLFTHRGLSGPAVLQISSYWKPSDTIDINLNPDKDLKAIFLQMKKTSKKLLLNELSGLVPNRLAQAWVDQKTTLSHPINQIADQALSELAKDLQHWEIQPAGTEGYKKAEVTAGGVSTKVISQQTMESSQKGLYFIGEVVDITGWLGGYNFQWAWSSGFVCAQSLPKITA
jgi:hypothetical protein